MEPTKPDVVEQSTPAIPADTSPAPPVEPQGVEEQKEVVTAAQVEQIVAEHLRRLKQSTLEKNQRIEGELQNITKLLQSSGVTVDAKQEANLRQQIEAKIDPPEPANGPTADTSPLDGFLDGVFQEVGMSVKTEDPEWADLQKVIDDTWDDPKGFPKVVLAAQKAAAMKQSRIAAMQETAPARVGAGKSTLSGQPPASGSALSMWGDAYSKK